MKNIIAWIVGIVIIWFVFSSLNTTTSSNSDTSLINSSNYPDENIESDQSEEDAVINDDSLDFNGYPCADDCSGHEAGYGWAEEHGITQDDVDNYSGNSNSFMEGMQSYVNEN